MKPLRIDIIEMKLARRVGRIVFWLFIFRLKAMSLFGIFVSERVVEYRFALESLGKLGLTFNSKILIVGCSEDFLPLELIPKGYEVVGVDLRVDLLSKFSFVCGDVMRLPFRTAAFDAVVAISTLEHIGLGYYGDPKMDNGDILAVYEIYRILKSGGYLLLTVPIGSFYRVLWQRVYSYCRIVKMLRPYFRIQREAFFKFFRLGGWKEVSRRVATTTVPSQRAEAIICIVARKTGVSIDKMDEE